MLLAAGRWFVIVVLVYLLFVHCFTLLDGCFRFRGGAVYLLFTSGFGWVFRCFVWYV